MAAKHDTRQNIESIEERKRLMEVGTIPPPTNTARRTFCRDSLLDLLASN
jgi:hypothetical protein